MQKLVKLLILMSLLLGFGLSLAQTAPRSPKFQVGLDTVGIGWPSTNDKGGVLNVLGFNLGLGLVTEVICEVYPEKGSVYWEVGTVALLDPYLGIGYDYRFNEQFYVGGGVNVFPLHLLLGGLLGGGAGLAAFSLWSIFPTIHLGVFLY
jgi:hypothetical protein